MDSQAGFVPLETARFIMRSIEKTDIPILFTYWSDKIVTHHLPITVQNLEEAEEMVDMLNGLVVKEEGARWAIVDKSNQMVVGSCGYHNVKQEHRRAELGYELGLQFWGQGIMQEVLGAVIPFCFFVKNYNRLEAFVTEGNNRSIHLLHNMGFSTEGLLRQYEFYKGRYQNQIVLSLLREDWPKNI